MTNTIILHNGMIALQPIKFYLSPTKNDKMAAPNSHITSSEKKDVLLSFNNAVNNAAIKKLTDRLE